MNITLNSSSSYSSLSVSGTSSTSSTSQKHRKGVIEDAAKALGMDAKDLVSELKDGKSLGDVADEKGVSRDTLASALKAGMPSEMAAKGNADEVVDKIIDQVGMPSGGPGGKGGPKGPPPGSGSSASSGIYGDSLTSSQQSTLNKLADLLGTDSASLLDDLKSGESLSTMLTDKGVSQDKLADTLQTGLLIDAKA
jgi:hypothetical protein